MKKANKKKQQTIKVAAFETMQACFYFLS